MHIRTRALIRLCLPMHAPIYTGDGSRGGADTHIHQCIAQVVAAEVVQTGKDVLRLVTCTLLNEERGFADVAAAAKTALHKLQDQGFEVCWLAGWLAGSACPVCRQTGVVCAVSVVLLCWFG